MDSHDAIDLPTQIAHPARAILRTTVQAIVGGAAAWATRAAGVEVGLDLQDGLTEVITGLVWVGATAAAAWIMSRPGVARVLAGTVLAPAPRRAIDPEIPDADDDPGFAPPGVAG